MAEAKTDKKDEIQPDNFDAAFDAAATAAEAQVRVDAPAVIDEAKKAEDEAQAAALAAAPPDGETAEAKTAREAAEKLTADAAAAEALKNETPEDKATREAAEAETARVAQAAADAKIVTDAAAATLAEINERKTREEAARVEAARVAAAKETPEQIAAREAAEALLTPYEPTAEEKTQTEKFKKDFPDEYAAMQAQFKGVDKDINARVSAAVQGMLQHINGVVAPVAQTSQELARQAHRTAIVTAHSDFDAVSPKLPDWIKTQPSYLQPAMQAVYDGGDAASVIALTADYKKATAPAALGKTAAELAAAETARLAAEETARKTAEDAASLLPVKGKRTITSPKGGVDANDFDGAFAEAADAANKK